MEIAIDDVFRCRAKWSILDVRLQLALWPNDNMGFRLIVADL
jgi:hypothetical protein